MNTTSNTSNIIVGLSGGVDSSVTAALLKQQGYQVRGVFMQNWENDDNDEYCSIKQDSFDAIAVADIVGIDIDIVNFAAQYKDKVLLIFFRNTVRAHAESGCVVQCRNQIQMLLTTP